MGILKSEDGGQTWAKSLDWSYHQERGIWAVRVSPINPNTVFAATTDGVYKSIDAGTTWIQVMDTKMAMDLEINPLDDQIVLATFGNFATSGKGVYKTVNGGSDWEFTSTNFPPNYE